MTRTQKAARHAVTYQLDFQPPRRRHDISTEYVVTALWLIGFSAGAISSLVGLRRSQTLGIVHRSGFESRSEMTDEQRQFHLDELREIRFEDGRPLDGGRLDGITWQIQLLSPAKVRPARRGS